MGDIYFKLAKEDVTGDKLRKMDLTDMDRRDREDLCEIPGVREELIAINIPSRLQETLHRQKHLSVDECISILRNSDRVWDSISTMHLDYPAEALMELGNKLDLYCIENQKNITPEFVNKFGSKMDISTFIRIREERGDIADFLQCAPVMKVGIQGRIRWTYSKEMARNVMLQYAPNRVEQIDAALDEVYSTIINKETLTRNYDIGGSHSTTDIMRFFNRHYNEDSTFTWDAFVEKSKDIDVSALADVFWSDFLLPKLTQALTAE
ncbi:hypothetical protein FDH34_gp401 [Serratia phage BF]|uniref:Uncharacterized protein n=1 Tax=Serratia phage BF TaxID=1962671 RepID=A0A1S6UBH8_9CAUD|nr:hypothetical protein FDH34_gp401 [Serratia phage BF]AQW89044.1 hypothetical protein BF_0519 [Serratia phage BF]QXO12214.1 hypothetical protein pEaSNUABM44_00553 [Erwinia phage pEa_SNUABM_44]QXO12768.1 hypothetical protein pEaSNUABM49_00555 [Erwinia phage pEa_SNUABM_49]